MIGRTFFWLKAPCANCPFRSDITPYLNYERAAEIIRDISGEGRANDGFGPGLTFSCHKTVDYDEDAREAARNDDGTYKPGETENHCAGALIMLHKAGLDMNNQMLRIARAFGLYKPENLKLDAPVYDTPEAMLAAHRKENP